MVCPNSLWSSYFMYNLHPQLLDLNLPLHSIMYDPVTIKLFISSLVTAPSIQQLLPHAITMCCNQMLAQAHALMITIQFYALWLIIITYHLITASPLHICISSISLSFVLSTEHISSDLRFSQQ